MTMTAIDLIRAGSIDPFDQNAAILELDKRLKRVEAIADTTHASITPSLAEAISNLYAEATRSRPQELSISESFVYPYGKPESDK
jgi:hypothetical protein